MYEWYRNADLCYVYLSDVDSLQSPSTQFLRSRWHTRGWTLQELIAPRYQVFLSRDWCPIGTKHTLARLLEEATGVSLSILNCERSLESVPISERMSWAASRQTSREEDEAYALLGIFGVHIPTIYGEGRHAFIRLQEEILKKHPDESIFVWGPCWHASRPYSMPLGGEWKESMSVDDLSEERQRLDRFGLLAGSPRCFTGLPAISLLPHDHFLSRLAVSTWIPLPEFTTTSHGIRARLPLLPMSILKHQPRLDKDCPFNHEYLALLELEDGQGNLIALPLSSALPRSSTSSEFCVGTNKTSIYSLYRVWLLSPSELNAALPHLVVMDVLIKGRHLLLSSLKSTEILPSDFIDLRTYIRDVIPYAWCRAVLKNQGYELTSSQRQHGSTALTLPALGPCPAHDFPSISHVFVLSSTDGLERLTIYVGELALLPNVLVTYETAISSPSSSSEASLLCRRPCTDSKTGCISVSEMTGLWWSFDLVCREHLQRTLRVGLLKSSTFTTDTEGIYWLTVELSEPFKVERVMRWVERKDMTYREASRQVAPMDTGMV